MTIQCFGLQNSHKWEYDQNTIPPLWGKVKIIMKLTNVNY